MHTHVRWIAPWLDVGSLNALMRTSWYFCRTLLEALRKTSDSHRFKGESADQRARLLLSMAPRVRVLDLGDLGGRNPADADLVHFANLNEVSLRGYNTKDHGSLSLALAWDHDVRLRLVDCELQHARPFCALAIRLPHLSCMRAKSGCSIC